MSFITDFVIRISDNKHMRAAQDLGKGKHRPEAVANKIIATCNEQGQDLYRTQVHDLTYFAHAWMLGLYKCPLLNVPMEVWHYGPAIPAVFNAFKHYKAVQPVKPNPTIPLANFTSPEASIITQVAQKYGKLPPSQLHKIIKEPNTPYHLTYKGTSSRTLYIPDSLIHQYYYNIYCTAPPEDFNNKLTNNDSLYLYTPNP